MGYVSFHFFVRSVRAQKTWIKMRMLKPKHIPPSAGPYPPFDRPNEAAVLRNYLNHPPAGTHRTACIAHMHTRDKRVTDDWCGPGPCIFVGPDGSGKSHILEQAIENRKMVVYLDLQREPGTLHFRFLPMIPLTPYRRHDCAPHSNQWRGDPHAVHQQDQLHSSAHGTPSFARALWPS